MTQTDRLLGYLRDHAGATSLDIVRECGIINTTGRISDLRANGHIVHCRKSEGHDRYYLREARACPSCRGWHPVTTTCAVST